jgi:hypothetical protein
MGQITIEIPEKLNRKYRIVSKTSVKDFISELELLVKKENDIADDEILGLWADRKESVEEIARNLRRKSNDRAAKK